MTRFITLILLLLSYQQGSCKGSFPDQRIKPSQQNRVSGTNAYTGKYQKESDGKIFYLNFFLEKGQLIAQQAWDKRKMMIKPLSGDNFIVSGLDWSVQFIRNKAGEVRQVVVMGKDTWTKLQP